MRPDLQAGGEDGRGKVERVAGRGEQDGVAAAREPGLPPMARQHVQGLSAAERSEAFSAQHRGRLLRHHAEVHRDEKKRNFSSSESFVLISVKGKC